MDQNVIPLETLKEKLKAKEDVVGLTFLNTKGAKGTILPGLSDHGKRQAEMTCTGKGGTCAELHVREQSDWHQVYLCRTCKKPSGKSGSTATRVEVAPTSVTLADGSTLAFLALAPDDSPETVLSKQANNEAFQAAVAAQRQAREAQTKREAQERADKAEREASERKLQRAKEKKLALQKNIDAIRAFAQKHNVCISDVTIKQLEREKKELEEQGA